MIRPGNPAMAVCDDCGDEAEAHEERNRRTGTLTAGFLPKGWKVDRVEGEPVHRCPLCVASSEEPFGDRREAFEARLDQLGTALLADIALSLGLPFALAQRWAGEWRSAQFRQWPAFGEIGCGDGDESAGRRAGAEVLRAGGMLDPVALGEQPALRQAGGAGEQRERLRLDRDAGAQRNHERNRGRWHGATMREQRGPGNRGKK